MTDAPLHIALTFDDNFWAPAYATMRSVCISTTRRKDLVFHLFTWHLLPEHEADFHSIAKEFGAKILHYPLDANPIVAPFLNSLPGTKSFPPVVYARLLLDQLLPPDVERILYLDSDLYVRAPVEKLLATDLEGTTLAAAPEPGRHHLIRGDDMRARKNAPFDSAEPYFNSGVLVIDRRRWGTANLQQFLRNLQQNGDIHALYHDQDVLNLAFKNDFVVLDPRWNVTKPHPAIRSLDPWIIHYTTGMKPWNAIAYVAFGSSYRHVMTRAVLRRYRNYRWKAYWRGLFRR